jgi:hypothetical protein
VRVREWKRPQEYRVDDAEDSDIRADAEGEDEDGDYGEGAVAAEGAKGVLQVLEKDVESHESSRFTLFEFRGVDGAEANQRLATGFQGSETALNVLGDGELDVGRDFGFEVGIELRLAEK